MSLNILITPESTHRQITIIILFTGSACRSEGRAANPRERFITATDQITGV